MSSLQLYTNIMILYDMYIYIASVITSVSQHVDTCLGLTCWRWPFLIEVMLLTPLYCGVYFIPKEDIAINIRRPTSKISNYTINNNTTFTNTIPKMISSPKKTSSLSPIIQKNSPEKSSSSIINRNVDINSPLKLFVPGNYENMGSIQTTTYTTSDTISYQNTDNLTYQVANNNNYEDEDIDLNISVRSPLSTNVTNTTSTTILHTSDKIKRKEEEKRRRSSLRQQAMTASMFDSMSLQHAYKGSTDKMMSLLGTYLLYIT